jgi:2-(1,2-epoxy-1,2-dihydrophenyl)acetyl-CoA isomerase
MDFNKRVCALQDGAVRTLSLNRASALNGFDIDVQNDLLQSLELAAADSSVRCLVLAGSRRTFCDQRDLGSLRESADKAPECCVLDDADGTGARLHISVLERLRSMPIPVIAAVTGRVAGAGMSLALNCDLVFAAKSAIFVQPFVKMGLIPDAGITWLLPRLMGRARALAWTLRGDALTAQDATNSGLIADCFPDRDLEAVVRSVAQRLAQLPTKAAVASRQAMDQALTMSLREAMLAEGRIQRELGFGEKAQDGIRSQVSDSGAPTAHH